MTNELAVEEYQKAIASQTATKCIKNLKQSLKQTKNNVTDCSTITFRALNCVNIEFFWSCPTELQIQSKKCAAERRIYARFPNVEKKANLDDCCKVENAAKQSAILKERKILAYKCSKELSIPSMVNKMYYFHRFQTTQTNKHNFSK